MATSSSGNVERLDAAQPRATTAAGREPAWLALAVGGLGAFAFLTVLMLTHVALWFDQPLLDTARGLPVDPLVWRVLSESANIPLIVIGVGIVGVLLLRREFRHAILVALLLLAVTAGSEGVKQLVARPRPTGTDPNIPGVVFSYPSGHVLEALVIFGIIALAVVRRHPPRAVGVLVVGMVAVDVALVGLARVALGAHYPSDVLGAILAGAGVLGLYAWLTHRASGHATG